MGTELDNSLLDDILQQVRPLIGRGKVADYIPALAEVSPDHLGIAVCTTKGETVSYTHLTLPTTERV